MKNIPEIDVARKTGNEPFQANGDSLPFSLLNFWQWAASDLVGNALRGVLAEYLVAAAVENADGVRTEWDPFDVQTPDGIKVEVKSGAYVQSWKQRKLSTIQFGIQPTQGWDAGTNSYSGQRKRRSDVYVFCVLAHKYRETIDPLDLDQWSFYVIPTRMLNEALGNQRTITLSKLLQLEPKNVKFGDIHLAIKQALGSEA